MLAHLQKSSGLQTLSMHLNKESHVQTKKVLQYHKGKRKCAYCEQTINVFQDAALLNVRPHELMLPHNQTFPSCPQPFTHMHKAHPCCLLNK